jgi:hypothetical protein
MTRPGHHSDPADTAAARPIVHDTRWRDRIVDLHVLAENGDPDAAATARRWLDHDIEARRVWDEVQRTCDRIRSV